MKTVRNSVFETNSSSMHAIVIPRGGYYDKKPIKVCMDGNMDFSERTLIERKLPDEKASYCFHLIMKYWTDKLVQGKWSMAKKGYLNITDKQVKENERILAVYRKFIAWMKKSLKKNWNISLSIKNVKVNCTKQGAYIEPKDYASTGCYGHAVLQSILMEHMLETIDKIIKPDADLSCLDNLQTDSWLTFYDMAYFILDPNAVIIQNTDECDDKERKQMQRMVMAYVKKNKGMCFVDWPLGG